MSDNDWFKQTTDAFIVETKSTVLSDEDNSRLNVYERLKILKSLKSDYTSYPRYLSKYVAPAINNERGQCLHHFKPIKSHL